MFMALFKDRQEGGQKLADRLRKYKNLKNGIIIALPRGGVVTAFEIAKILHLPLDIIIPRKIGAPIQPELAIGAICEDETILNDDLIQEMQIPNSYIKGEIEKEKQEAQRRMQIYRKNRGDLNLRGKTVILVDDGIATGSTMLVTVKAIKKQKAKKIIIAVPVAPLNTLNKLEKEVEEIVCLAIPEHFFAVGQFYEKFDQTQDAEVIKIINQPIS